MTETDADFEPTTATLPPPPRAVTARVRRRAWADPIVRFWWLAALVVLAAAAFLAASGYQKWADERRLMEVPAVDGTITRTDTETVQNRPIPPGVTVAILATRDGKPIPLSGTLAGYASKRTVMIGDTIPVHIDPADPSNWTARNELQSLANATAGGQIAAALAVPPAAFALIAWLGVLRIWRTGDEWPAQVARRQTTPLAPRAGSTRCVLQDAADRRLFTVFVPLRAPDAGQEALQVLVPAKGRGRRLAASWFE